MGIFDKVKNFIDNSDEDTIDEDIENVYDDSADDTYSSDSTESAKSFSDFSASSRPSSISSTPNIVDLRSSISFPALHMQIPEISRKLPAKLISSPPTAFRFQVMCLRTSRT